MFNPQNPQQQKEFVIVLNNFTLRCHLEKFSLVFLIEQNKDSIKEIYTNRYFQTTLPSQFTEYFDSVQDLFEYINDNPIISISLKDLIQKNVIYIKANIDNKIQQLQLPVETKKLTTDQLVKRQNLRMKATLQKTYQQLKNAYKIINQLKLNESFNNEDYEKLKIQNKRLLTENRKINSEKASLFQQNVELKNRLHCIKTQIRDNLSVINQSNNQSFHNHTQNNSNLNLSQNPDNLQINQHSMSSLPSKKRNIDSLSAVNSSKQKSNQPKETVSKSGVIQISQIELQAKQQNKSEKNFVDLDIDEPSSINNSISKNMQIEEEESAATISHHNSIVSHDQLSVASKPHSIQSNSLLLNFQKLDRLSSFVSNCDTIKYSKKQQKEHKKAAKFQKAYTYFEDNISHICPTDEQNEIIFNFFVRKVKTLKLLYRASQNNFDIVKFHKNCDRIKHTLLLVQTQYGKKIGAYTPIQYQGLKKPKFFQDPNCETFLFSVTNKQKHRLLNSKKAHFNFIQLGPSFGRLNLHIQYRGHLRAQNKSVYPFDFENSWATKNQATKSFIGSDSQKFKILEWQIYQIQFFE